MSRRSLLSFLYSLAPPPDHVSDATLIRRFVQDCDRAAFELLVRRHADTVWTVCRGILRNEADAEDAFQATFLALAKQISKVNAEPTVGGWLYRVAVNAALKRKNGRSHLIERRTPATSPDSIDSAELHETQALIHQELATLRDSDRLPLVLCDLEGHTREQAAGILGWPIGTVNGRLSRARELLKSRLIRRGITAPAAIAAITAPTALSARASAIALGIATIPESISTLATGALTAMTATKFKLTAALAASVLLATGAGTMVAVAQFGQVPNATENQTKQAEEKKPTVKKRAATKLEDGRIVLFPDLAKITMEKSSFTRIAEQLSQLSFPIDATLEEGIKRIQQEKYNETLSVIILSLNLLGSGQWDVTFLNQFQISIVQLQQTAMQLQLPKQEYLKIVKARLLVSYTLEYAVKQRADVGSIRKQQYHEALIHRYQCELDLAEVEDAAAK